MCVHTYILLTIWFDVGATLSDWSVFTGGRVVKPIVGERVKPNVWCVGCVVGCVRYGIPLLGCGSVVLEIAGIF